MQDADIMWFRNPFPHFYADTNFQISCDRFWGNPADLENAPNGGFNYVKSSDQTIRFYKFWYESRELYPDKHDQDVLNMIKHSPMIKEIGLEIKFLDTAYFGGFCQPKDLNLVCTMHANCCAGLDNKIHDLKIMLDDWRNYTSLPENVRRKRLPSWSVPQRCGYVLVFHSSSQSLKSPCFFHCAYTLIHVCIDLFLFIIFFAVLLRLLISTHQERRMLMQGDERME